MFFYVFHYKQIDLLTHPTPVVLLFSEDKLTVASIMADTIMEMVIHQLEKSVNKMVSGAYSVVPNHQNHNVNNIVEAL